MKPVHRPVWLRSLETHAGLVSCLVVHGEVYDLRRNPWTTEYQRIPEMVAAALREGAFKSVIEWDPVTGVHGRDAAKWETLASSAGPTDARGATYAVAPDARFDSAEPSPVTVEDFVAIVLRVLSDKTAQPTAFVANLANFAFSFGQNPSQSERDLLAQLAKAIVGAAHPEDAGPKNLLVLITPAAHALPLSMLPGPAHLREVVVPLPDRQERSTILGDRLHQWRLKNRPKVGQAGYEDLIDALDGMSCQDILNIEGLSVRCAETEELTADSLLSLYRHGIQTSAWEALSRDKLLSMPAMLEERVKGQTHAIEKVTAVTIRAFTGLSGLQHSRRQRMPKGSLFFVGPTGVGKTELAKSLAEFLFGDEEAFIRFDMSEFNHEHSDQRLIGAPPGYVGYEEGGQLTNAIRKRPFCVLLFDEIEKAHVRILDKFLQILEDGRLTDGRGQTVSFSEAIIIFTSNIGAAEIAPTLTDEETRKAFNSSVRDHFVREMGRPELLNRIGDNIVAFNFVRDRGFLAEIMRSKLGSLRAQLQDKYGIRAVRIAEERVFLEKVAGEIDPTMGGRGAITALTKWVIDPISTFLFNEVPDRAMCIGQTLVIELADEDLPRVTLEAS
ncbi:AAA family ATPase [Leisingera thetidis]|uniref:AAA family ATPase n=1 Tax=Leisingera thetidis TaxID=2930199 RepID=UPI0021F70506|nr:AAA family ATPase [Leisingera thetidis]